MNCLTERYILVTIYKYNYQVFIKVYDLSCLFSTFTNIIKNDIEKKNYNYVLNYITKQISKDLLKK